MSTESEILSRYKRANPKGKTIVDTRLTSDSIVVLMADHEYSKVYIDFESSPPCLLPATLTMQDLFLLGQLTQEEIDTYTAEKDAESTAAEEADQESLLKSALARYTPAQIRNYLAKLENRS